MGVRFDGCDRSFVDKIVYISPVNRLIPAAAARRIPRVGKQRFMLYIVRSIVKIEQVQHVSTAYG